MLILWGWESLIVQTRINSSKFSLYVVFDNFYISSTMFFERQQPWFKRQNFMFNNDPMVMKADRFLICAQMNPKPQTDIIVTIEELVDE